MSNAVAEQNIPTWEDKARGETLLAESSLDNLAEIMNTEPVTEEVEMKRTLTKKKEATGALVDPHAHFDAPSERQLTSMKKGEGQGGWFAAAAAATPVFLLSYSTCVSYAQLMVTGTPVKATVVTAMHLVSSGLTGLILPWKSACPLVVSSADISITMFYKHILNDIMASMEGVQDYEIAAAGLLALPISTILMSLIFTAVGRMRVSVAISYLPYPVIAGFLGAIGWAIFHGSFAVLSGAPIESIDDLAKLAHDLPMQLASAVAMVLIATLASTMHLVPPSVTAVGPMSGAFVCFWLWALCTEQSMEQLRESSWLFPKSEALPFWNMWTEQRISQVNPRLLLPTPGTYLGFGLIILLSLTLRIASIEGSTGQLMDVDDELTNTGLANLAMGGFGAVIGSHSPGLTSFNKQAGGVDIKPAAIAAIAEIALWLSGIPAMDIFPRFMLSGILMNLGTVMLIEWLWAARHKAGVLGCMVIYGQVLSSVLLGLMPSVLIGVCLACFTAKFREMSLSVLKYHLSGRTVQSNVDRPEEEQAALRGRMNQIEVLGLEGYLTEGPVSKFSRYLTAYIDRNRKVQHIILDFGACQKPNASASAHLAKLDKILRAANISVIYINIPPELEVWLKEFGVSMESKTKFDTMHRALEHCENAIIRRAGIDVRGRRTQKSQQQASINAETLSSVLADLLGGSADFATALEAIGKWQKFDAGAKLTSQGAVPRHVYFATPHYSEVCELIDVGTAAVQPEKVSVHKNGCICGAEGLLWKETCRGTTIVSAPGSFILSVSTESLRELLLSEPAIEPLLLRVVGMQLLRRTDALGQEVEFYKGGGWRGGNFDQYTARVMTTMPPSPALPRKSLQNGEIRASRTERATHPQRANTWTARPQLLKRRDTITRWADEWLASRKSEPNVLTSRLLDPKDDDPDGP